MTREQKYRILKDEDTQELKELNNKINNSKYFQKFHVNPVTGLLNDPNGFVFFNGKWHLFYQWFPFGGYHGAKNWYHTVSNDLLNFTNEGIGLKIDTIYDNCGAYSGSAFVENNNLNLVYTGNHRDENDVRFAYQLVATLENNNFVKKDPIISMNSEYTEHQRDPKIIKYNDIYYLTLGAQNHNKKGRLLVYYSNNLYNNWKLKGELKISGYDDFGYMWECPDLFKLQDKWVFSFSPQGLKKDGYKYNNVFQNGYIIGQMDFENLEFIVEKDFEELDRGFDFYASQTAFQNKYDTAVLVSWMGLPDSNYHTENSENFSGCLSLVRELSIIDNTLIQKPIRSIENIKNSVIFHENTKNYKSKINSPTFINLSNIKSREFTLKIYYDTQKDTGFSITYKNNLFEIKRDMFNIINENQGITRTIEIYNLDIVDIFIDNSSIEIFINNGVYTMTSRVFPIESENTIIYESDIEIDLLIQQLNSCIENNFVL